MTRLLVAALIGLGAAGSVSAQVILLDTFTGGGPTGILTLVPPSSWLGPGNVVLNGTTVTVGNTALNDAGWGTVSTTIDATGMNFVTIVAQVDSGNVAPFLVVAFEDSVPNVQVFSVSTFAFTSGLTTVQIPISSWGSVNPANITGWSIGGGTTGLVPFKLTFDNLSLTATAVPEPGTYAALAGLAALGFAVWRRRAAAN